MASSQLPNLVIFLSPLSCFESVFVNKDLLAYSHAYLFMYHLWFLSSYKGQSGAVLTDSVWPTKPKILTLWTSTEQICCPLL